MPKLKRYLSHTFVFAVAAGLASSLSAQQEAVRFPITGANVAAALTSAGLAAFAQDVLLPSGLSSTVNAPVLKLMAAEALPGKRLRVRVICSTARECIPFFATVTPSAGSATDLPAFIAGVGAHAATPPARSTQLALRAGQETVLLMEDAQMHITLPVISIDTGQVGTEVRVSSLDRKTMYHAIVLSAGLVRGVLP